MIAGKKQQRWKWGRRVSFGAGFALMLATYALVSAMLLAFVLLQLRADTIAASQHTLTAFAQLSDEQTTRTFQNVEQVLEIVGTALTDAEQTSSYSAEAMNDTLRRLMAGRPFLEAITVIDRHGRIILSSGSGPPGLDLSDRAYFAESRDNPGIRFRLGEPVRSRTTQEWILPATRSLLFGDGEFAGVVVASLNPMFFDRVWTVDETIGGQATALWTAKGALVMRSPFVEQAMGGATFSPELLSRTNAGASAGNFQIVSRIDGEHRLLAFRRLSAFPTFVITVTQTTDRALAPWRHIARLAGGAWAIALATLCGLAAWLIVEWNARRAEQDRYRMLFDANAYPMAVIARDTRRYLAVNDASLRQYGWSREEFLAKSADDLRLPEDVACPSVAGSQGALEDVLTAGGENLARQRHRIKDGAIIDVAIQSRPIEFGLFPATLVTTQNVTGQVLAEQNRHLAEDKLRQSQDRYRTLFEAAPYAVIVSDRDSLRLLDVNEAATALYGWTHSEMLAMTANDLYVAEDRPAAALHRREFSPDVTRILQGLRHRRRDGTSINVEMAVRLIDYQDKSASLTIIADVSERLHLEQARQTTEAQLRQAQKMEAVGQLTGGVAHDFNNLLTVILANADEVQEEAGLEPRVKARLDQIAGAVLRAAELTSQLLAFSRKQALAPKPTDLNELVTTTGKLLRRTLGEHVELVVDLAPDLWMVNVDRAQLETALINLCVNARDATPDGGRLLIQSRNLAYDPDDVPEAPDAEARDYVRLSVTDTGTGMPPDVLGKVFEPFFTTKDVGKGSGLGLSMVYGFIKQSGGTIGIRSEIGRGTTINLYLPRSNERAAAALVHEGPLVPRGSERILVVEDELQVRGSVARQLASLGYEVLEAADGLSGLAAFEATAKPYDLLLTDVVMPGAMSGKALGEEVARRWPETVVTFMSGYAEDAFESGSPALASLLEKPFRKHELAQFVREALDTKLRVPPTPPPTPPPTSPLTS